MFFLGLIKRSTFQKWRFLCHRIGDLYDIELLWGIKELMCTSGLAYSYCQLN